jgi:hypothetical protein
MSERTASGAAIIVGMSYCDCSGSNRLCRVFGIEKPAVYSEPDNAVSHAELTPGSGMILRTTHRGE